ncbi:FadR/GntR family transcriptional regulator [Rhizobium sp. RAF56]|uniref:FadR/GntR family transcriptional regulator n=1 Tax=Rhizobium sp. RAF56 TaxID=3233062 RepID=UPI003F9C071C
MKEERTAVAMVTETLTRDILTLHAPGTSLPSEADLAERFAVSRLTVREALKVLAGKGLVDLGRGRRPITREPDGSAFGEFLAAIIQYDPKGVFDLVEVRLTLEIQSVSLAAKRVSRPGLVAIESALQGMKDAAPAFLETGDPEAERRFHHFDVGFHEALAMASGNRVLTFLFEAMLKPLEKSFYLSRRGRELRGQGIDVTIAAHQRIFDCVREGNQRAAAEAMRAHLEDASRDMRAALGTPLP